LSNGISSIVEGLASIMSPVAQAIAPVFTLIGTLVEGVLKLGGVLLNTVGVVLKLAGAFTRTLLSPVIVGFANAADGIRYGMGKAFDFVASRIEWASKKLEGFYKFMAKMPVLGDAFAGGDDGSKSQLLHEGVADGAVAASAEASSEPKDTLDLDLEMYKARLANEQALADADKKRADADKKAAQDRIDMEQKIFEARRANEEAIAAARKKSEQEQFDFQMQLFAAQRENEQKIRDAEAKRAEEAAKVQEKMTGKQEEIDKITAERAAALGGKSNEALKANDVRSSEGMAQFIALATGREDPAIAEYRKQTQKLEEIRAELRVLQQEKVDILGAAA
jgi:hypothetical protein